MKKSTRFLLVLFLAYGGLATLLAILAGTDSGTELAASIWFWIAITIASAAFRDWASKRQLTGWLATAKTIVPTLPGLTLIGLMGFWLGASFGHWLLGIPGAAALVALAIWSKRAGWPWKEQKEGG